MSGEREVDIQTLDTVELKQWILALVRQEVASGIKDSEKMHSNELLLRVVRIEETLVQQQQSLELLLHQVDKRFEQVDKRFEQVDKRFEEMQQSIAARFEQVDKRFEQIDKRFEEMQQSIAARFEQVDKRFEQIDKRFAMLQWFMGLGFTVLATLMSLYNFVRL